MVLVTVAPAASVTTQRKTYFLLRMVSVAVNLYSEAAHPASDQMMSLDGRISHL